MLILSKLHLYIHHIYPFDYHAILNNNTVGISRSMFGEVSYSVYNNTIICDLDDNIIRYYYCGKYMMSISI